jgi:hypothetical protein
MIDAFRQMQWTTDEAERHTHEATTPTHHIVVLRGETEASLDPATELCCSACGSLAFRYPRALDDDKPVICAGCGEFVSTYGEIKRRLGEQD